MIKFKPFLNSEHVLSHAIWTVRVVCLCTPILEKSGVGGCCRLVYNHGYCAVEVTKLFPSPFPLLRNYRITLWLVLIMRNKAGAASEAGLVKPHLSLLMAYYHLI